MNIQKTGVLLLNTGTPEQSDKKHVAKYLRQFLMDPRVIDLPWFIRWPLINLLIIPTRVSASTEAYQKIWTEQGSPLLVNCLALKEKLAEKLNASSISNGSKNKYIVELGMRYGQPDIPSAIQKLKEAKCNKIIIMPLFPQYASASTGSVIEEALNVLAKNWNIPDITVKSSFYDDSGFIEAYAKIIQKSNTDIHLNIKSTDFLLFSYHGLPWRHIEKSECGHKLNYCNKQENIKKGEMPMSQSCPAVSLDNAVCYRAQCYATSRLLAEKLGLNSAQYDTAFQSRLGKTPWITPYSDLYLSELIKKGIKNLSIACPSFTADCLETIEEIGIRMKEQWIELGGENFTLSPCLNADSFWVEKLSDFILAP